ncbi:MAG TPA: sialidase family protein [Thermoanaerobaculia bacterium]
MNTRISAILAGVAGALSAMAFPLAETSAAKPKILVGPNILVSRDGNFPHVELMLAANPKNGKNLVGAAITEARPSGGQACRTYASDDGGSSWNASEFREQIDFGGGDPQVGITPSGTALFTALAFVKDDKGQDRAGLYVYRSEDGGRSWKPPADLGYSYDHEQIAVDRTFGKYAGRVYIGVLHDYPVYRVGVFRSDDDGRTFTGPVEAANGGGTIGINDQNLLVLSDGTLVVPYIDFEFLPEKVKLHGKVSSSVWLVTSSDGGVTFSPRKKIATIEFNLDERDVFGVPALAADAQSTEYKNRMYVAWPDFHGKNPRILFSYSADKGGHWSAPAPLDAGAPAASRQFQPVVAVNKDGVVAVSWFDTRDSSDGKQYHEYFTASLDGGRTFLPSVRISSALSNPKGPGNSVLKPTVYRYKQTTYLTAVSAATRWASGGDYMGLTADKDGVFHPFWADSRSGTFQIYTARVQVETPPKKESRKTSTTSPPEPPKPERERVEVSLLDRVEFVFDPTRYDALASEVEYPIRLKNTSKEPIYPPIRLEVTGFGFEEDQSEEQKKEDAENAPTVLNATNQKKLEGAIIEFRDMLGNLEALEPGAQTGPVVMRLKLVDPGKTPSLRIKLTGFVPKG